MRSKGLEFSKKVVSNLSDLELKKSKGGETLWSKMKGLFVFH